MKIFAEKLNSRDEIKLLRSLHQLLNAHIPLLNALEIVERQFSNKQEILIKRLYESVIKGNSLGQSIEEYSNLIRKNSLELIKLGETGGNLSEMLKRAAEQTQAVSDLKRKLIGVAIYPMCIAFGAVLLTLALVIFVFPKITPLFKSLNADLPLITRALIKSSDFIINYWPILSVVLGISLTLFFVLFKKYSNKGWFLFSKVFFLKKLISLYWLSNIARSIHGLLLGSMSLSESINVVSQGVSHPRYAKILKDSVGKIENGENLSDFLRIYPKEFNSLFIETLGIAEKSGELQSAFEYIAEVLEQEFERAIKGVSVAVEPILMVLVSIIIGVVALSIMLPIYSVTSQFQHV